MSIKTTDDLEERKISINFTLSENLKNPLQLNKEEILEFSKYPYIEVKDKKIIFRTGRWHVKKPIVIPSQYEVHISAGTILEFDPESYLIVNGPIYLLGTKENPVRLIPKSNVWKGLYVYNTPKISQMKHVSIEGTSFLESGLLHLTGGVTFYKSDIQLENVTFLGTDAEDALNIAHSNFSMKNVLFKDTRSDAFDSDFSTGDIENTYFVNVGGDGLDTSGSDILVNSASFQNIKDKSISAGEKSRINAGAISINKSGTGVVAKDSSILTINNLSSTDVDGFVGMAYNKKGIFTGGILEVRKSNQGEERFISQIDSTILYEGTLLENVILNVDDLYKSGSMKK